MGITKAKRIEHAKQAISNLKYSIETLENDGASESAIKEYRDALHKEEAKLNNLLK